MHTTIKVFCWIYLTACFVEMFIGYGYIVAQIKLSIVIMLLIYNFTGVQSYANDDCNGNNPPLLCCCRVIK